LADFARHLTKRQGEDRLLTIAANWRSVLRRNRIVPFSLLSALLSGTENGVDHSTDLGQ
jgi:hypothetical protein